jgi:hypothetical protein
MAKEENLEQEFDRLTATGGAQNNWGDAGTVKAVGYLGKAVLRLDKTSSRLAIVNIVLTAVILVVGLTQIALMLRGH